MCEISVASFLLWSVSGFSFRPSAAFTLHQRITERVGLNLCRTFLFADDIFLVFRAGLAFPDFLEVKINFFLNKIATWLHTNSLLVSPSKSKGILFRPSRSLLPELIVSILNARIEVVSKHRCLGVIVNDGLNFRTHIDVIHGRITSTLRRTYIMNHLMLE